MNKYKNRSGTGLRDCLLSYDGYIKSALAHAKTAGAGSMLALALAACGGAGEEEPISSSSAQVSSSSASSVASSSSLSSVKSSKSSISSSASSVSSKSSSSASSLNSSSSSSSSSSVSTQLVTVYAVNAGGARVTAAGGQVFEADRYFTGGTAAGTGDAISGTSDDALYQSERWGVFSYDFPVAAGNYDVTLHLAETYWTAIGNRRMSVEIEGDRLVDALDIFASVGHDAAMELDFSDIEVTDGTLNINFTATVDAAKVSAIAVKTLGVASSSSSVASSTASSVSSSSVASSSSSAGLVGSAANGRTLWNGSPPYCHLCHGLNSNGTAGTGESLIDPNNLKHTTLAGLADYIERTMPKNLGPELCVGQCAADTAAFIKSWQSTSNTSSSASSSSAASSTGTTLNGAQLYTEKGCAFCHGADGQKVSQPIIVSNWTLAALTKKIADTMPEANPGSCVGDCAAAIAEYILSWQPAVTCDSPKLLPRRLRLLTNLEYANTVNDLLGRTDGSTYAAMFEANGVIGGFDNNANGSAVTNNRMNAYWNAAQELATKASLTNILRCDTNATMDTCAAIYVPEFGKKAFRRPLTTAERTTYTNLFKAGASKEEGARLVINGLLASPNFLYREEIGVAANGSFRLTPYETANLLSYTFWGTMPDLGLMTAADNNRLQSVADINLQVQRLLADNKAKKQIAHFGKQWLHVGDVTGLQRDTTLYPAFTAQLAGAMNTELEMFLQELFLQTGYGVDDLFTSNFTFANNTLANFYGIPNVTHTDFRKITTNAQRGGVLTMGAVLATNSSFKESHPIHRGLMVRRNLLCQEFGTPPPDIGEIEPLDPNKPTRERFAAHTTSAGCQSCHQYIDEIGFAFENYNAIGQYRIYEGNNLLIDASGAISGLAKMTDVDSYDFGDAQDLAAILSGPGAPHTASCLAEQFHRYMDGVKDPDSCTVQSAVNRWTSNNGSIRDLWLQAVASDSFLKRQ